METLCPRTEKCPLFNNNLLKRPESADVYRKMFCTAGVEGYTKCKRYIVSEKVGKCADFIMPNSTYSIDQIIERMKREQLI